MTERLQRLVMHAFRGVPTEMTVDFGTGESTVIYGENGTGKSTIAHALEWYFKGEIELLSHEGRQHAVRYVGGDDDGATSVEVFTSGMLGGKVVFPDERTPDTFEALRRETFLLRGRTLADFINKTKTEKWKALVEYSAWTRSKACEKTCNASETTCGRPRKRRKKKFVSIAALYHQAPIR